SHSPALNRGVDHRGTKNATQKVTRHVRPGAERAFLLRYIRINLPRTTRVLLAAVVAGIGAAAVAVATGAHAPFPAAGPVLWVLACAAAAFAVVALLTRLRVWGVGAVLAAVTVLVYLAGVVGDAPFVWNGGTIAQAATWNLLLFLPLAYLALYWALRYGMIVASPDDQNFTD
ncbi:hypothetical protein, partial [Mobilicoccus pelagius]